jgi:hypothetical protein
MIRIAALTVALLAAGAATAAPRVEPPARFDHKPSVRVVVVPRTLAQINAICVKHDWGRAGSCTMAGSPCIIMWPKGQPRSGLLWRHELAHCNGWAPSHPK